MTNSNPIVSHVYQHNGIYTVKLIANSIISGCPSDSISEVNLINCQGMFIEEFEKKYCVSLFPNPTNKIINFKMINKDLQYFKIELYTESGINIIHKEINNDLNINEKINLFHFKKGVYLFILKDNLNQIIYTKRIILE